MAGRISGSLCCGARVSLRGSGPASFLGDRDCSPRFWGSPTWFSSTANGTTAAERFFGAKPRPVFECLLEGMPELPRPTRKRPSAPQAASAGEDGWPNPSSPPVLASLMVSCQRQGRRFLDQARHLWQSSDPQVIHLEAVPGG
jgi:hypothetical protein